MPNLQKEKIINTEDEINRLRSELAQKEIELKEKRKLEEPIIAPEKPKEAEKIKEAEKVIEEIKQPKPAPSQAQVSPVLKDKEILKDVQHIMSMKLPQQVKVLVYLTFKKGVRYAINIAKQTKNPYLLDEFHDTLIDELHDLLVKKHKI